MIFDIKKDSFKLHFELDQDMLGKSVDQIRIMLRDTPDDLYLKYNSDSFGGVECYGEIFKTKIRLFCKHGGVEFIYEEQHNEDKLKKILTKLIKMNS